MAAETKVGIILEAQDRASRQLKEVSNNLGTMQSRLENMQRGFSTWAVAGTAAFGAVSYSLFQMVKAGANLEQTTIAFETMLGSAEDAATLLKDLTAFGLKTPFEITQLRDSTKQLLAYGIEGDKVIDTLKVLGDISAGVGMDKLPNLILAFGQVKAATRLTGMELRQFTEAGVPLLGTLADQLGVTAGEVQDMVSSGSIGFDQVEKALASLTGEGGKFFNLMERQSRSLAGVWSNFQDTVTKTAEEIGMTLVPTLTPLVQRLVALTETVGEWVQRNPQLAQQIILLAGALTGLVAVVGILGLTLPSIIAGFALLASPVGLVVVGLGALIAVFILARDRLAEFFTILDERTGLITLMRDAWENVSLVFTQELLPALQELWDSIEPLKPALEAIGTVVGGALVLAFAALVKMVEWAVIILTELFTIGARIQTFFMSYFVPAINAVVSAVQTAVEWTERLIAAISRLNVVQGARSFFGNAMSSAAGLVGLADGGIVTRPTLAMVGEGGEPEAVIPLSKLGAVGGGGITVNIMGGNFLSEDAGVVLGDQIVEVLRRSMRI